MTVLALPKVALSIKQPFAWLLAHNHKDIENRDWPTRVRGDFFIHASKTFDQTGYEWVKQKFPDIQMPRPSEFETGGIVGRAKVVACVSQHKSKWFVGPFGFVIAEAHPIKLIPLRGGLSFFHVPPVILARYSFQIRGERYPSDAPTD